MYFNGAPFEDQYYSKQDQFDKVIEQKITKHLKFPFQFDEDKLNHDLSLIMESKWISHFNTDGYNGVWKAIPLYSNNGDETNIFSHSSKSSCILILS